ncbi:hypothetical protein PGO_124180 [Plasmodium gonderi]|uniref:Uncharacterized protein n=1 Tax=Plasmodium gonderi TaxID=77519 RepID=A0A1Y1JJK7_PLAGO|nr:hypothetical protein PGO_124180 [Plasmodium gonderi]GAW82420.1 hypothetical protein PGO_124180 [Plasmodium gonderi]
MIKLIVLLLLSFVFKQMAISKKTKDVPLINYQMIPSQRWKVSAKELVKLKEKLKIFVASEIQKEGSFLLRKYYKEFYISDEENENDTESRDSPHQKETESVPSPENSEMDLQDEINKSFDINGPILLI